MPTFEQQLEQFDQDAEFQSLPMEQQAKVYSGWFADQVQGDEDFMSMPLEEKQGALRNFLQERFAPPPEQAATFTDKLKKMPEGALTGIVHGTFRTMQSVGSALEYVGNRMKTGAIAKPPSEWTFKDLSPTERNRAGHLISRYRKLGLGPEESMNRAVSDVARETTRGRYRAGVGLADHGQKVQDVWGHAADRFETSKRLKGKRVWENPELLADPEWWSYGIGDMFPSLLVSIAPGSLAVKGIRASNLLVNLTPKVAARITQLAGATVGGMTGGGLESTATYRQVLQETGDEKHAARAAESMFLLTAGLNAMSVGKYLEKIGPGFMNRIKKAGLAGAVEGITEGAEEPAEVVSKIYSRFINGQPIPENVMEMFVESFKDATTVIPLAAVAGAGPAAFSEVQREQSGEEDAALLDEWSRSIEDGTLGNDKIAQRILEKVGNAEQEAEDAQKAKETEALDPDTAWQMTAQEFIDNAAGNMMQYGGNLGVRNVDELGRIPTTYWMSIQDTHRKMVAKAIADGRPVPQHVKDSVTGQSAVIPSVLVEPTTSGSVAAPGQQAPAREPAPGPGPVSPPKEPRYVAPTTLGGVIKEEGFIHRQSFKEAIGEQEYKDLPQGIKRLLKDDGLPYDIMQAQLIERGVLSGGDDILDVLMTPEAERTELAGETKRDQDLTDRQREHRQQELFEEEAPPEFEQIAQITDIDELYEVMDEYAAGYMERGGTLEELNNDPVYQEFVAHGTRLVDQIEAETEPAPAEPDQAVSEPVEEPETESKKPWEMRVVEVTSAKAAKSNFPLEGKVEVENGKPIYTYSTTVKWDEGEKTFEIKTKNPLAGVDQAERLHEVVIKQALADGLIDSHPDYPGLTNPTDRRKTRPSAFTEFAEEKRSGKERRLDEIKRKKVEDMTAEERADLLLYDVKTGLPNGRAFEEEYRENPTKYVARLDMDNLHMINKILTYEGGDKLIVAIAEASTQNGIKLFLEKGDEFLAKDDNLEHLKQGLKDLQDRLSKAEITHTLPDGRIYKKTGIGVSYGTGQTLEEAEAGQTQQKEDRLAAGLRVEREAELPGLVELTPEKGEVVDQDTQEEKIADIREPKLQKTETAKKVSKILHFHKLDTIVMDGEEFHTRIENPPYLDLVIERHTDPQYGGPALYLTHYIEMGGDLVTDSEMVFAIDPEGILHLAEVAARGPGGEYRTPVRISGAKGFARMFARNLINQGFAKKGSKIKEPEPEPTGEVSPQRQIDILKMEIESLRERSRIVADFDDEIIAEEERRGLKHHLQGRRGEHAWPQWAKDIAKKARDKELAKRQPEIDRIQGKIVRIVLRWQEPPEAAPDKSALANLRKDLESKGQGYLGAIGYKILESDTGSFYYQKTKDGVRYEKGPGYPATWSMETAVDNAMEEAEGDIESPSPEPKPKNQAAQGEVTPGVGEPLPPGGRTGFIPKDFEGELIDFEGDIEPAAPEPKQEGYWSEGHLQTPDRPHQWWTHLIRARVVLNDLVKETDAYEWAEDIDKNSLEAIVAAIDAVDETQVDKSIQAKNIWDSADKKTRKKILMDAGFTGLTETFGAKLSDLGQRSLDQSFEELDSLVQTNVVRQLTEPQPQDIPLPEGITRFQSGAGRSISDVRAFIKHGYDVGVVVTTASNNVIDALGLHAQSGHKIFADTGAFKVYNKGGTVNWDQVFKKYKRLVKEAGDKAGNIYLVAPDIIGDQAGSYQLNDAMAPEIEDFLAAGAKLILPIQKGEETPFKYYEDIVMLLGGFTEGGEHIDAAIIPGIPSNKEAFTEKDFEKFITYKAEFPGIHFLGISEGNKRFQKFYDMIKDPAFPVSVDYTTTIRRVPSKKDYAKKQADKAAEGEGGYTHLAEGELSDVDYTRWLDTDLIMKAMKQLEAQLPSRDDETELRGEIIDAIRSDDLHDAIQASLFSGDELESPYYEAKLIYDRALVLEEAEKASREEVVGDTIRARKAAAIRKYAKQFEKKAQAGDNAAVADIRNLTKMAKYIEEGTEAQDFINEVIGQHPDIREIMVFKQEPTEEEETEDLIQAEQNEAEKAVSKMKNIDIVQVVRRESEGIADWFGLPDTVKTGAYNAAMYHEISNQGREFFEAMKWPTGSKDLYHRIQSSELVPFGQLLDRYQVSLPGSMVKLYEPLTLANIQKRLGALRTFFTMHPDRKQVALDSFGEIAQGKNKRILQSRLKVKIEDEIARLEEKERVLRQQPGPAPELMAPDEYISSISGRRAGIPYVETVQVEETGDTIEIEKDAGQYIAEIDERIEQLRKLQDCIG